MILQMTVLAGDSVDGPRIFNTRG